MPREELSLLHASFAGFGGGIILSGRNRASQGRNGGYEDRDEYTAQGAPGSGLTHGVSGDMGSAGAGAGDEHDVDGAALCAVGHSALATYERWRAGPIWNLAGGLGAGVIGSDGGAVCAGAADLCAG